VLALSFQNLQLLVVLLELRLLSVRQEKDTVVSVAPPILLALQERRFDVADPRWTSLGLRWKPERSPNEAADGKQAGLHSSRFAQLVLVHSIALHLARFVREVVFYPRCHRSSVLVHRRCLRLLA
jgi:hypothetical protein